MAVKSKLETTFTGNDKPFQATANRVKKTGAKINQMAAGLGGAFAAIGGGMLVRALFQNLDRLGKLSTTYGIAADSLFRLGHVAQIGGADVEILAKGMKTFKQLTTRRLMGWLVIGESLNL